MAQIMSHKRWMKMTYGGRTSIRSGNLERVDKALKAYHESPTPEGMTALKGALEAWIAGQTNWRTSVRNRHNAVEHLKLQLEDDPRVERRIIRPVTIATPDGNITWTATDAEDFIEQSRTAVIDSCFKGRRLEWRPTFFGKLRVHSKTGEAQQKIGAVSMARTVYKVETHFGGPTISGVASSARSGISSAARSVTGTSPSTGSGHGGLTTKASEWAREIMSDIVPSNISAEVTHALNQILPDFVGQLIKEMIPLAGVLSSGASVASGAVKALVIVYKMDADETHARKALLSRGAPASAMAGLTEIMDRELTNVETALAIDTAAFAAKAGALAGGDPGIAGSIVSIAARVAKLTNTVRIIVRDVLEKNEANRLMATGDIGIGVFEKCPILGAYYIAVVPHSTLLNIMANHYGDIGWMDDSERLITRHINPLRERAAELVRQHRFVINELQSHAGLVKRNEKKIKKAMERAAKGESEMDAIEGENIQLMTRGSGSRDLFAGLPEDDSEE
jgi:hypothetical protein